MLIVILLPIGKLILKEGNRPLKFNNIKMLVKKKVLPRRKCATILTYKEDEMDQDDAFICESHTDLGYIEAPICKDQHGCTS